MKFWLPKLKPLLEDKKKKKNKTYHQPGFIHFFIFLISVFHSKAFRFIFDPKIARINTFYLAGQAKSRGLVTSHPVEIAPRLKRWVEVHWLLCMHVEHLVNVAKVISFKHKGKQQFILPLFMLFSSRWIKAKWAQTSNICWKGRKQIDMQKTGMLMHWKRNCIRARFEIQIHRIWSFITWQSALM